MIEAQEKSRWKKWKDAAQHCDVPKSWLRNQVKAGNGPKYAQPSPRLVLFREQGNCSTALEDRGAAENCINRLIGVGAMSRGCADN